MICTDLPTCVISEALVWQAGLCPAAVKETNLAIFGCHVGGGGFNHPPVYVELEDFLFAMLVEQLVYLSHVTFLPAHSSVAGNTTRWKAGL